MEKYWYAAMQSNEDTDWGTGSYDLEEAKRMAVEMRKEPFACPNSYVAVITEGNDPIVVDRIDLDD